jgi:hypothetical protein
MRQQESPGDGLHQHFVGGTSTTFSGVLGYVNGRLVLSEVIYV